MRGFVVGSGLGSDLFRACMGVSERFTCTCLKVLCIIRAASLWCPARAARCQAHASAQQDEPPMTYDQTKASKAKESLRMSSLGLPGLALL